MRKELLVRVGCLALGICLLGCDGGGGGEGELRVLLEAEDTITSGLRPGVGVEDIRDGWEVRFGAYHATLGDIRIRLPSESGLEASDPDLFTVDLSSVPESGLPLWTLGGLRAGRWDFYYGLRGAASEATRHEGVPEADFAEMMAGDQSYLVDGTLLRADGQSCPPASLASPGEATPNGNTNGRDEDCYDNPEVHFRVGISTEASYGPCQVDDVPGVSVPAGGSQTVAITIHGDHLFFNGFPEGAEGGVMRLAQWLADCDLDLDGEVTEAELRAIAPSDLAEIDGRFQLGGSPIAPLDTMWTYLTAQLRTQAHFQGEGECPLSGL
jgi:hypothetical protein